MQNVNPGQTGITLAKVKVSASGGDFSLSNVIVNTNTNAQTGNFSNIRVYSSDNTLLGSIGAFNGNGGVVYFNNPLVVKKDSSNILTVIADIGYQASGSVNVGITNIGATNTGATGQVTGLPVYGNNIAAPGVSATATNPTLSIQLDASTPVTQNISPGQAGVAFTKVKLSASGGDVTLDRIFVVSDYPNVIANLFNIKVYDGSTLLGSISSMNATSQRTFGTVLIATTTISNYTSKILTITADVSGSAAGNFRLGLDGVGYAGTSVNTDLTDTYGSVMTVTSSGPVG